MTTSVFRMLTLVCVLMVCVLIGYAAGAQESDSEARLRAVTLKMEFSGDDNIKLAGLMEVLTMKAHCILSYQAADNDRGLESQSPANALTNFDMSLTINDGVVWARVSDLVNVTAFDALSTIVNRTGMKWRLGSTNVTVIIPVESPLRSLQTNLEDIRKRVRE